MINMNEKLTIFYDDNSVFADYSNILLDYGRGSVSVTVVSAEDKIYVGFYKPINVFYTEMATSNTETCELAVKYYNGSSYVAVDGLYDDSDAFSRSGFIRWNRGQTDEALSTVNSTELYWYEITLDANSSAISFAGINIVFSDDQDLKRELFEISKYLPTGEVSHILSHVSARDEIIQSLNLMGKSKIVSDVKERISSFDLLDVSEVKLASTYLVLAKIMMSVSDQVGDSFIQKSQLYRRMYENIINAIKLTVDSDDDGIKDDHERESINFGLVKRL